MTELHHRLAHGRDQRVVTVNLFELHHYVRDPGYRALIDAADAWTADGWPVMRALRRIGIETERVTGSGLCLDLLGLPEAADLRRVAVFGSEPHILAEYGRRLSEQGRELVHVDWGAYTDWTATRVAPALRQTQPDLVLVAVGTPQGVRVAERLEVLAPCPVVAVGAGLGMAVGLERRAPRLLQDWHLEWTWRLVRDPERLWRRYLRECLPLVLPLRRAADAVCERAPHPRS